MSIYEELKAKAPVYGAMNPHVLHAIEHYSPLLKLVEEQAKATNAWANLPSDASEQQVLQAHRRFVEAPEALALWIKDNETPALSPEQEKE